MFRKLHNAMKDLPISGLVCLTVVLAIAIPLAVISVLFFHQAQESLITLEGNSLHNALSVLSLPEDASLSQVEVEAEELASRLSQGKACTWYLLDSTDAIAASGAPEGIMYPLGQMPTEENLEKGYVLHQDPYRGKMLILFSRVNSEYRLAVIYPMSNFNTLWQAFFPLLPLAVLLEAAGILVMVLLLRKYLILPLKGLLYTIRNPEAENTIAPYTLWNNEIGRVCGAYLERFREYRNSLEQIGRLSAEQRASEIEVLQNQINAHFIYNTLNNIQWLASANRMEDVVHTAQSLDILLRACAKNDSDYVAIEDEMTYVGAYLSAQKIRFHDLFDYVFELDPFLMQMKIPKFIVQPIVENSIYHGFLEGSRSGGKIRVSVFRRGYRVIIEVYDNGVGIASEDIFPILNNTRKSSDRYMGVAIGNINKRIRLLCGRDFGIGIESRKGSFTKVQLILPIIA